MPENRLTKGEGATPPGTRLGLAAAAPSAAAAFFLLHPVRTACGLIRVSASCAPRPPRANARLRRATRRIHDLHDLVGLSRRQTAVVADVDKISGSSQPFFFTSFLPAWRVPERDVTASDLQWMQVGMPRLVNLWRLGCAYENTARKASEPLGYHGIRRADCLARRGGRGAGVHRERGRLRSHNGQPVRWSVERHWGRRAESHTLAQDQRGSACGRAQGVSEGCDVHAIDQLVPDPAQKEHPNVPVDAQIKRLRKLAKAR